MIEKILKAFFDFIDYKVAHQVPSKLGYGHQIDSPKALDQYSQFMCNKIIELNRPVKVIELAIGRGVLAMNILENAQVEQYTACDIDPSGIEVLEKRIKNKAYAEKVDFRIMNCLDPPEDLQDSTYDIVIAEKLLHLLSPEEVEEVFQIAYKLLKPNGLFFLSSASQSNYVFSRTDESETHPLYRPLKADLMTRLWYNIATPYVYFITRESVSELATKTGFSFDENLMCPLTEDYITLALWKKPDQPLY